MADYLLMSLEDERAHAAQSPREMAALIDLRARFVDDLRRAGQLRDAGRLRPSKEGVRVHRDHVEDGPFADDGKTIGGYAWIDAPSLDDAARDASACPALASDELDVRPVLRGRGGAARDARPGKIFACIVLGNATDEAAWVQAMDRVEATSHGGFPDGAFQGGVRLMPPTSGRRVVTRGERRASFDGPFLESKEVIGGVFVVRMASLADVVRWATPQAFLAHGALEIRELWRT